jgi:hypothetical protein
VQKARYLGISYDEVTTIDNQFWCNVHAYVVDNLKKIPLLLNLERVIGGGNVDNLIQLIMRSLMEYKVLTSNQIGNKLICFGLDGIVMFTWLQTGVAFQFKSKVAPFVIVVHYMAHRTF